MRAAWVPLMLLVLVGGCAKPHGSVLGRAPKGDPRSVISVKAGDTPPDVTVGGVMIEKCPIAGCWFRLRDSTGTILVDTKPAGFVVVNVPTESHVTVSGKVVTVGDEVLIEAAGIRY